MPRASERSRRPSGLAPGSSTSRTRQGRQGSWRSRGRVEIGGVYTRRVSESSKKVETRRRTEEMQSLRRRAARPSCDSALPSSPSRRCRARRGVASCLLKSRGSAYEIPLGLETNAPVAPCAGFNTVLHHAASLLTSSLSPGEYAPARRRDAARTWAAGGGGAAAGVETGMTASNWARKRERACRAAFLPR